MSQTGDYETGTKDVANAGTDETFPPYTVEEVTESVEFMRQRNESGQGTMSSAMCRLSLPMSQCLLSEIDSLRTAITAALGEIKRSRGTPRLALIGVERILKGAVGE